MELLSLPFADGFDVGLDGGEVQLDGKSLVNLPAGAAGACGRGTGHAWPSTPVGPSRGCRSAAGPVGSGPWNDGFRAPSAVVLSLPQPRFGDPPPPILARSLKPTY